jgi:hypothetical protein
MGAALWATPALAETPAGETPPATDTPAAAPTPPPPPVPAAVVPTPSAVATEAKPPTAAEAMPATRPDVLPPIDVGAWSRVGSRFQGADPSKVNDWSMDTAYVELHAGGKIHKKVSVTLNLNANMTSFASPSMDTTSSGSGPYVSVEDAIISFDAQDEFHIWAGRLLVPVDRANASGPFFMIPWNYPGFFAGVSAPKEGPSGRNQGAVVWGDISGGKLTYLAGVFDSADRSQSPLYSGRLRLALLDPEPGFWGNASYFGDKDLLSIGVGGQFQKHGSASMAGDKDWAEVNADVLFEKKIPGGGFYTAEGAYYHYNVGDGGISDAFYVLAAYATPTVGVGNIQPMARYQWEKVKGDTGTKPWNLDVGLSYLIKGPALRLMATYSYTKLGPFSPMGGPDHTNSVQLGAQAIFF